MESAYNATLTISGVEFSLTKATMRTTENQFILSNGRAYRIQRERFIEYEESDLPWLIYCGLAVDCKKEDAEQIRKFRQSGVVEFNWVPEFFFGAKV